LGHFTCFFYNANISSELRKLLSGTVEPSPKFSSNKIPQNIDPLSSGPPPQAMQVQRLRVDKKTGNKDDRVSYESFKGVDASPEDLRQAKQEIENRVRKLTARINTDTAELKVWEVWLNVATAYETESHQEKLRRG
jgi:hypothetical protein